MHPLGLAIGGVFGQEATAPKAGQAPANARAFFYQAQPGQSPGYTTNQPVTGGGAGYVVHATDGAHDEEAAKLIALDAQMQQKSQALLGQYAEAGDDEQKSKIKEQLAEALEQQFSVQQQLREREVAKIEARVKKLRQTIDKRNGAKRSIIDKRLDQLIREAEGLGWNAPAAGPVYPSVGPAGANFYTPLSSETPIGGLPESPRAIR
ncbi:MAG TPA: hypothetical protein VND64_34190 [Pirellulales bacterium]|nr:hypothetical protein [Pirellulales bacterium]